MSATARSVVWGIVFVVVVDAVFTVLLHVTGDLMAPHVSVRDLTLAYGDRVIQSGLRFEVRRGEIFVIMGDSGCGKSTLMRHMTGLDEPAAGEILYEGCPLLARHAPRSASTSSVGSGSSSSRGPCGAR